MIPLFNGLLRLSMRYLKAILYIMLLSLGSLKASDSLFEEANLAYEEKNYEQAIAQYKLILKEEPKIAEVHFNLANAYYQINQLGESILCYEKALKLDPGSTQIQHNLQLAYLKSDNEIEPLPPLFFVEWWHQLLASRSANSWAKWAVFFAWIGISFFLLKRVKKKQIFGYLARLSLLSCFGLVFLAFQKNNFEKKHGYAIVMSEQSSLRSSPNTTAEVLGIAYEGLKVELIDSVDTWVKVKLEDETEAWIEEKKVAKF